MILWGTKSGQLAIRSIELKDTLCQGCEAPTRINLTYNYKVNHVYWISGKPYIDSVDMLCLGCGKTYRLETSLLLWALRTYKEIIKGEEKKYPLHANRILKSALAIGTKKVLYISLSDSYPSNPSCSFEPNTRSVTIFNNVESFYDNQASTLLNESPSFISFDWNFVKINPSDLGIRPSEMNTEVIKNTILTRCNLNLEDYDIPILEADEQYKVDWCGGPGCAGDWIYLISMYSNQNAPLMGNTLTHELNHFFGALDIYGFVGSNYQWDGCLQGPYSQLRAERPNLQVVRAEIGWADLNNNGIIDVVEDSQS